MRGLRLTSTQRKDRGDDRSKIHDLPLDAVKELLISCFQQRAVLIMMKTTTRFLPALALLLVVADTFRPAFCWTTTCSPKRNFALPHPVAVQPRFRTLSSSLTTTTRVSAQNDNDDTALLQEAQLLKQKAEKARLEAQQMEKTFVDEQLQKLEQLLEKQTKLSSLEQQEIQDKIDRLKEYRNPKKQSTVDVVVTSNQTKTKQEEMEHDASLENLTEDEEAVMTFLEELVEEVVEEMEEEEYVGELSEDDVEALGEIKSIFLELSNAMNSTFEDDDLEEAFLEMNQEIENALAGNITQEDLDVIKGLKSFVSWIPGLNKTTLMKSFTEATKVAAEIQEMEKQDPIYGLRLALFTDFFPERRQNLGISINQTDMQEFVEKVIHPNNESFAIKANPRKIGDFYLVEGTPQVLDGDILVNRLDDQLQLQSGLKNTLQYFYIRDPSVSAEMDEVQMADMMSQATEEASFQSLQQLDNMEPPALLVVPAEYAIAPNQENWLSTKALLSSLAVVSTAFFAGDYYNPDGNVLDCILSGFIHPVVLYGLFGLSLVRELGRFAAGALNKIEFSLLPSVFPYPDTGLLYTNSQFTTSPKNNKALFDFAISGPLLGMIASWGMLSYGLVQTALTTSSDQVIASLPHVPLDFLQLSWLTSATIESIVGTDVLLSLDPVSDSGVAVHPLVLAGHVGLLINALTLLPISAASDGGRMSRAVFTRFGSLNEISKFLANTFVLVQGFRDWNVSGLLILYLFVSNAFADKTDLPCRNDVDPAGPVRLSLLMVSTLVAIVAVSPAF